jgi:hypothetical protein
MSIPVTEENFARAESDRMFTDLAHDAGGVNRLHHFREPSPVEHQAVIRLNRDTLYSFGVVDISNGAVLTMPDPGDRYLSVMIVNEDHYINEVFHGAGRHELTQDQFDTPYVLVAARTLVDASDPADLAAAAAVQDGLAIEAASATPFQGGDFDTATLDATRQVLLDRAKAGFTTERTFGRREDVDRAKHLIGTAAGWGGLPQTEATYVAGPAGLPATEYRLTARDVPVDAFWSLSVYNAAGFFEPNDRGVYNINSVSGQKNPDGSMTVHFGGCEDGRPNCIPITDGWNYLVRLYRPRPEVLDGSYTFPTPEPVA